VPCHRGEAGESESTDRRRIEIENEKKRSSAPFVCAYGSEPHPMAERASPPFSPSPEQRKGRFYIIISPTDQVEKMKMSESLVTEAGATLGSQIGKAGEKTPQNTELPATQLTLLKPCPAFSLSSHDTRCSRWAFWDEVER